MVKKMLGVFTAMVAALAVVGVAWASGDDGTSTSITTAASSTSTSQDDSSASTGVTKPSPSTSAGADVSPSLGDGSSSTSTGVDVTTSTSSDDDRSTTSTSLGATTSTSVDSSTSTSLDDSDDRNIVPDGVSTHSIPGVGQVTIEVLAGDLLLVGISAPGWDIEEDKLEPDRIELEFTSGQAEAEFEARLRDGRVEVRVEVDSD